MSFPTDPGPLRIEKTWIELALRRAAAVNWPHYLQTIVHEFADQFDLNVQDQGPKKRSALHWALAEGSIKCAEILVEEKHVWSAVFAKATVENNDKAKNNFFIKKTSL